MTPKTVNLVLNTTYFGRNHGVMVLLDAISKQALFVGEITHKSNTLYLAAIVEAREKGTIIQSIMGDGRKDVAQLLPSVPVQMCHFHQVQIVNRYLTRNPKSIAACELRALVLNLKNSTETSFKEALAAWHMQLPQRTQYSPRYRTFALHTQALEKPPINTFNSLKRHLEILFTYERHPELCIPKTTCCLKDALPN